MTTPNHDAIRDDVGLYVLGALDPAARAAFESHVVGCDECRAEVRAMMPLLTGLAMSAPQVQPSPELRNKVLQIAQNDRRAAIAPQKLEVPEPRGPGAWGWLAAAAAVALAIGLSAYALQLRGRVADLTARLADVERSLEAARNEVVVARRAVTSAQSTMQVLLAPDLSRVDLDGQPVAREAHGRAFYSPTAGGFFTASNLPPLPAARVYQLWIVTATAPQSAGLLAPDASGTTTIAFPPSSSNEPPVAFAVTIEPSGGVPAPTGDKALIGMVGTR